MVCILIGGLTVFLAAKQPESNVIAVATLVMFIVGYGVGRIPRAGRAAAYIETILLSLTVFLLLAPSVTANPDPRSGWQFDRERPRLSGLRKPLVMLVVDLCSRLSICADRAWFNCGISLLDSAVGASKPVRCSAEHNSWRHSIKHYSTLSSSPLDRHEPRSLVWSLSLFLCLQERIIEKFHSWITGMNHFYIT